MSRKPGGRSRQPRPPGRQAPAAGDAAAMLSELRRFYGALPSPPEGLFAYFVWEALSAGASPVKRDLAWRTLRRLRALTPDAMARVPAPALLDAVAHCGARRDERVRMLRAAVDVFRRRRDLVAPRGGRLLAWARAVWALPHLGPAARHRALLFAGAQPVLPVDEATARVWSRLKGRPESPRLADLRRTRRDLAASLAATPEVRRAAVLYLAHHARAACHVQAPRCGVCPLRGDCRYEGPGVKDQGGSTKYKVRSTKAGRVTNSEQ